MLWKEKFMTEAKKAFQFEVEAQVNLEESDKVKLRLL